MATVQHHAAVTQLLFAYFYTLQQTKGYLGFYFVPKLEKLACRVFLQALMDAATVC